MGKEAPVHNFIGEYIIILNSKHLQEKLTKANENFKISMNYNQVWRK
jgi:hypothetical protein